jgi:hypothetical protein
MNVQTMTPEQIRAEGLEALRQRLGVVGMVRFLQQFETGRGDYTSERQAWVDQVDAETLFQQIEQERRASRL